MADIRLTRILETIRLNGNKKCDFKKMRHDIEALAELFPPEPEMVCKPVSIGAIEAEWIFDPTQSPSKIILYLHGGGFVMGSVRSHRGMGSRLAKAAGAKMLLIDYRKAPENPFPAALEDTAIACQWLLEQGHDPGNITVAGDSAGGNLAVSTLVTLRDKGVPMPAAAVIISPWLDMRINSRSMKQNAPRDCIVNRERLLEKVSVYLGDTDPEHPLASPILADLHGLPPLMIHVGDAEVLLDDSKKLERKARECGVAVNLQIWPDMFHAWHFFAPILPEGRSAIETIGHFIKKHAAPKVQGQPAKRVKISDA